MIGATEVVSLAGSSASPPLPSRGSPAPASAERASRQRSPADVDLGSAACEPWDRALIAGAWPSLLAAGPRPPQAEARQPEASSHRASAERAQAAVRARRRSIEGRRADGEGQGGAAPAGHPVLLGHEVRSRPETACGEAAERGRAPKGDAGAGAQEAFLARRKRVASRLSGFRV